MRGRISFASLASYRQWILCKRIASAARLLEEMARVFSQVDLLLVPSLRDEMLVITNFTGHPSLTLRAGFVEVSEARSDWAPDPQHPLPKFSPPRRVPHGVTLIGRLFDEGTLGSAGLALEESSALQSRGRRVLVGLLVLFSQEPQLRRGAASARSRMRKFGRRCTPRGFVVIEARCPVIVSQ